MEKMYLHAKVTGMLSMALRGEEITQVYLLVEYTQDDKVVQNAVHLAKSLKYEFDGLYLITQEVCDKALLDIPKNVRVYVDEKEYCNLEAKYYTLIRKALKKAIYN